jgi:hypothetical protein
VMLVWCCVSLGMKIRNLVVTIIHVFMYQLGCVLCFSPPTICLGMFPVVCLNCWQILRVGIES